MPEILTESFCERCGTRYTFESAAPPRTKKLGKFKTLSKGLKNYVLSDDSSMDEAMAAARSDEEREVTSHQLDAFHATFNFCMTCRQYTCGNCWNQAEGRCLTCAPHLGHEILPSPFPDLAPNMSAESLQVDASAWPMSDLAKDAPDVLAPDLDEILAINRLARISEPQRPEAVAPLVEAAGAWPIATEPGLEVPDGLESVRAPEEAELAEVEAEAEVETPAFKAEHPVFEAEPRVEAPVFKAEPDVEAPVFKPEPKVEAPVFKAEPDVEKRPIEAVVDEPPAGVEDRAAAAARRTAALLSKFRPGQNIDAELAAYEASVTADPSEVTPTDKTAEPIDAAPAEPVWVEPEIVAAAPEPEAPAPEPQPEPVAAFEVAAPVEEPAPELVEAAAPLEVAAEAPVEVAASAPVEPAPEPTPGAPEPVRADRVEQPTWRIVAPETPAVPTNGHPPVDDGLPAVAAISPVPTPAAPAEPQWPANPQWPVAPPSASLLATRGASSSAATEALWAASARDVLASPSGTPSGGVQSCSSCGLSLSATARFCRRCGSRQGA